MPHIDFSETFSYRDEDYGPILDCDTPMLVNPFSHFGQSNKWPNGFPMRKINSTNTYVCGKRKASLVQQAMINDDNYNAKRFLE